MFQNEFAAFVRAKDRMAEIVDSAFLSVKQCVGIPVAWFFDRDSFCAAERVKTDVRRATGSGS